VATSRSLGLKDCLVLSSTFMVFKAHRTIFIFIFINYNFFLIGIHKKKSFGQKNEMRFVSSKMIENCESSLMSHFTLSFSLKDKEIPQK
jgi:hypothetical protein